MIRSVQRPDLDAVAAIWLDTNRSAHHFVPARYWEDNLEAVKGMLPEAEVYVYEDGEEIQGFVGLDGDYVAGIFVCSRAQSRGIGRALLEHVKGLREYLTLNVYQKNRRAVRFYQREGFSVQSESVDEATGEAEYFMRWEKPESNASL